MSHTRRLMTSVRLLSLAVILAAPALAGPGTSNPYGGKRVLVIGIDGLRSDALQQSVLSGSTPNMAGLIANGTVTWNAYAGGDLNTSTQQPTISGPGWASILTGTWIDRHNVNGNATTAYDQPAVLGSYLVGQAPHFARLLKQSTPGAYVSSIVSWSWIEDYLVAAQPQWLDHHVKGIGSSYALRDADVATKAAAHLAAADPDVLFLHFDQVDGAGHANGFSTTVPSYMTAIANVDAHIGTVLAAINARPQIASEPWLVILTSDHGGNGSSHGGQSTEERTIPFIVSGGGVPIGVSQAAPGHVAVVPTLMRYLGAGISASWQFAQNAFVTGPTFTASNSPGGVVLNWTLPAAGIPGTTGFEIRRNGTPIATAPLSQSYFTDSSAPGGLSTYQLVFTGTAEAALPATIYVTGAGQFAWDDANPNNQWNTTDTNWSGSVAFADGSQALFSGNIGEIVTIQPVGVSPTQTTILGNGSYAFSGGPLGGTLTKGGTGILTLGSSNNLGGTTLNGGGIALGHPGALGNGALTVAATASTDTASAAMLSTVPLAASAVIPNPVALPADSTAANRTLYMNGQGNGSNTIELSGKISGGSSLTTLYLNNNQGGSFNPQFVLSNSANDFRASIRINRGGLRVVSDAALGNPSNTLTIDSNAGADLTFLNAMTFTRATSLVTSTDFDTGANAVTASGVISGGVTLTKNGSGTLTLTGSNSFSGPLNVASGSLVIGGAGTLGSGAHGTAVSIAAGTTLSHASSAAQTFSGVISGAGQITKPGSGALTLSGANTYSGGTSVSAGPNSTTTAAIRVGHNSALGTGALTLANIATFTALYNPNASQTLANAVALSSTAGLTTNLLAKNATTLQLDGAISGGSATSVLFINTDTGGGSTGLVKLTHPSNTFQGLIRINRGGLAITSDGALGNASNSIHLDIGTASQIGLRFDAPLSSARNVLLGSSKQVLDTNGNAVSLSGVISGAGQLFKSGGGSLTLSNNQTYSGITTVDTGSLMVNGSLGTSTSTVTVSAGATLGGTGSILRPVLVNGTLAPGSTSPGTLTLGNTLTLTGASRLAHRIADWNGAPGTGFDTLAANSIAITASTAARLVVTLDFTGVTGFSETNRSFPIASANSSPTGLTADNWTLQTSAFPGAGSWSLQPSGNALVATYTAVANPFVSWASAKGLSGPAAGFTADPDNDGLPNGIEFVLGSEPNPSTPGSNSVSSLPVASVSGNSLVFTFSRNDAAAAVPLSVEFASSPQGPWTTASDPLNSTISTQNGSPLDTITVTIPHGGAPNLFARLKVAASP